MTPWDIIGWLLVGLLVLGLVSMLLVVLFFVVDVIVDTSDNRAQTKTKKK